MSNDPGFDAFRLGEDLVRAQAHLLGADGEREALQARVMELEDQLTEVREFAGLLAAYYDADSARRGSTSHMAQRRQAQVIVLTEVLRFLDGDARVRDGLRERGIIPLTREDMEPIAHGRAT